MTEPKAAFSPAELRGKSRAIRQSVLTLAHAKQIGHLGSAFSIVDLLVCLYFGYLRLDPQSPRDPDRDRFILSKGHGCSSLYAVLAERGFFPKEELQTFVQDGSRLPAHPSSLLLPGVEASTGSLGHGLNIGSGMALAARMDGRDYRTVVLVSDGECDEGSTWEAALAASHWRLGSLTCIVDYNKIQSFGRVSEVMALEPFADKWRAFGWHVQEARGHAHREIQEALAQTERHPHQPSVIIAHTVKGKGVSFMQDTVDWHYRAPNDKQYVLAMSELSSA